MFRSPNHILRPSRSVGAVLLLSFVMIVVTVLVTVTVLLDMRQRELVHAKGEIVSLNRILSDQTTRTFDGIALTMRGIRERLSDNVGRSFDLDSIPIHFLLQARIIGLPQVKSVFLVDRVGKAVNSSHPDFIYPAQVADRDFFLHFVNDESDDLFISRPEKVGIDDQRTYFVSARLLDSAGKFRGVLVAEVRIDYFESLYDSIGPDLAGRILLLNRDGVLMAGRPHDKELFGKTVGNPASLAKLRAEPLDGVVVGSEESTEGRRFVAYRQVAKYPLVISTAVNEDEALASWMHVVRLIVAAISGILLMVLTTTFLIVRNLSRKDLLEEALKEGDEQIRHMVQSVTDAIVTVDSVKRIVLFNSAAEKMFGVRADQAIGRSMEELLSRCLTQSQLLNLLSYLEQSRRSPVGPVLTGIIELLRNGQGFPAELTLSTTMFCGEILLTAVFRDLTERMRAEHELFETNRQLQELSASLQLVREEERTRISRELHDELGQLLTGIRMEVSWLGGRLSAEQQGLVNKVASIKGQIDQTIASVRRISSELRPLVLDDLGFAAAAGWYVDQFSARTGVMVTLVISADDPEQGGVVATALFRILQESLTNVARHAMAMTVEVQLRFGGGEWTLSIKDNGVGFVQGAGRRGGIGLVGMRERIQMLGGRFCVTTAPGEGTLIEVVIRAEKYIRETSDEKM
ncbi:MAG: histidine kinase [Burkholderiales bacterium]